MTTTLRTLSFAEVETLVDWAAAEGWNPGLNDAAPFHAADPDGFIGAFVNGEMVAGISAVAYGNAFGFVGFYICRPDWRGKGYGKTVWNAGMARLSGRTIGLDGVVAQQENYRHMGFVPAHETVRYSGRFAGATGSEGCPPVAPECLSDILAYDRQCFPAQRQTFLERWLEPPHYAITAARAEGISGYGVVRKCRVGSKVGPLFADDPDTALHLLKQLASANGGGDLQIDVPVASTTFTGALAAAGFVPTFTTTRMYKGNPPNLAMGKVFGITTFELG